MVENSKDGAPDLEKQSYLTHERTALDKNLLISNNPYKGDKYKRRKLLS